MKQKYQTTKKINQKVINEILEVEKEKGLTAENLLEKAKNKNNVLHDLFEWSNANAGDKWRLHQARMLINEVKIIVEDKVLYGIENVRVTLSDGNSERFYKPIYEILSNENQRQQLIQRAISHQEYWANQHEIYEELKPIVTAIKKTKASLEKKWQKKKK